MEFVKIICPECGLSLPDNAPAGLCPVCLLAMTFKPDGEVPLSETSPAENQLHSQSTKFQPYSLKGTNTDSSGSIDSDANPALRHLGEYEVYEEVGRGGMGTVYRARQIRLNRRVALKMIRSGKFSSELEIRRFQIEAAAAAQLDHPAIVPVFEIGEHEGLHYFSMPFIDGKPLSHRLNSGPLPPREAAELLLVVANAVQYAHDCGVIHRDLKPGNILIDSLGQPRISDFGLAKLISPDSTSTSYGEFMGTPSYMPPEIARGGLQQVGPVADVYSLGAILYATLTGSPPFHAASSLETLRQVVEQEPVAPRQFNPAIPKDLETITLKCLQKDPSRRYLSAGAIAMDLQRFLGGHAIAARPVTRIERLWRWSRRRPELSLLMATMFLFLGVGVASLYLLHRQYEQAELLVRAEGLVHQIETAEFAELPRLIAMNTQFADPSMIEDRLTQHDPRVTSSDASIRLSLAKSSIQKRIDAEKIEAWLELSLEDLVYVAQITQPLGDQVRLLMQPIAFDQLTHNLIDEQKRLRAVCLLANFESSDLPASVISASTGTERLAIPDHVRWEQKIDWSRISGTVLQLLGENPGDFKAAHKLLRPVAAFLRQPIKDRIVDGLNSPVERNLAISFLGELLHDDPEGIADLACIVDSGSFHLVTRHIDRLKSNIVPELTGILQRVSQPTEESDEQNSNEQSVELARSIRDRKTNEAQRRAMAAAWLFRLGRVESVWALFRQLPDPTLRYLLLDRTCAVARTSYAIAQQQLDRLLTQGSSSTLVAEECQTLAVWSDPDAISELQMVILLVGDMARRGLVMPESVERSGTVLSFLFRHHPHPGIHSSSEWALKQIGLISLVEEIHSELTPSEIADGRSWYVTPQGATMALFRGPIDYRAGVDWTDPDRVASTVVDPVSGKSIKIDREPLLQRRINRDFAIGTKEVSLQEFLKFDAKFHQRTNLFTSSTLQHPANKLSWYLAAEYCNWLSQQAGLDSSQWCFVPNQDGRYAEGMTLAENYLHRTGYRMPTEVEWEYACRAGTTTPRFFGLSVELLPQFAWFRDNSRERSLIVSGTLKPNQVGLYDVFGNVIEWCMESYTDRPGNQSGIVPDEERDLTVDAEVWRVLRGGHLYAEENELRATDLWTFRPLVEDGHFGLRLARTIKVHPAISAATGSP